MCRERNSGGERERRGSEVRERGRASFNEDPRQTSTTSYDGQQQGYSRQN